VENTPHDAKYRQIEMFAARPASAEVTLIEVTVGLNSMIGDYANAFVHEAYVRTPLRAEQVGLTVEELNQYLDFLLFQRIECIHLRCTGFRKLKPLLIPAFFQYVLCQIGEVIDSQYGYHILPISADEADPITLARAFEISHKLEGLKDDMALVRDAMPRSTQGNPDVMITAVIADYVRSMKVLEHPISSYVSAFLNLKLQKEAALGVLYRVRYDDVGFIRASMMGREEIFH